MAELYEHIRWRRLPDVAQRHSSSHPMPSGPPLRSSAEDHGRELESNSASAISESQRARQDSGIDPSRLLVLQFTFLEESQREFLERFGVQVVDEREYREEIDPPYYIVSVRFISEDTLQAFIERSALGEYGITGVDRERASNGGVDRLRLLLRFPNRATAKAFADDQSLSAALGLEIVGHGPIRKSHITVSRFVVQFPDALALRRFQRELEAYRESTPGRLALTAGQRREFFDALEDVSRITAEDRLGRKLREDGVPAGEPMFYIDVDLWHPGSPALVTEATHQFRNLVERTGGRVTDSPTAVAETLLLARVKGSQATLDALLNYDRVARVDLPPTIPEITFSIFDPLAFPTDLPSVADDGPLACVVDSGLRSGHPLLSGLVVDERDFDSGENSPIDMVGHGTHVAGIVAYGDIRACVDNAHWEPRVRLLSAKVMRRIEQRAVDGDVMSVVAGFADDRRVETQLRNAITTFAHEYGCRIFNLSLGNETCVIGQQRQLPWAYLLDELARELDVVIVTSAGNVSSPDIPQAQTAEDFQRVIREQILGNEHLIIDPASAINALTVGSVARWDVSFQERRNPTRRPPLVGAPQGCPSPFTRSGLVASAGSGVQRAVKPDLVSYGGNYCLGTGGRSWNKQDPDLGEVSLKYDYQGNRLLSVRCGTSMAAPYITHVCALTEARLRRQWQTGQRPSANLIRSLVVHSARVSATASNWLCENCTDGEGEQRKLRTVGYGMPDQVRAMYSTDNRVVLLSEDEIAERYFHVYEVELPDEFVAGGGSRFIRVTLAYDPPIRGTRKEYLSRTMWFRVYRGLDSDQLVQSLSRPTAAGEPPSFPSRNVVSARPPYTVLQWSTVQSAAFEARSQRALDYRAAPNAPALLHVVVGCTPRFPAVQTTVQRYALVCSIECLNEGVRLYQAVRQRVAQRVRVQWPTA